MHAGLSVRGALMASAVAFAALAAVAVSPSVPSADAYFYGAVGSNQIKSSSYVWLRSSRGWSDGGHHKAWVAATRPTSPGQPLNLYGSWVDGWGYACHSYAGNNTLYGILGNFHSVTQNPMSGAITVAGQGAC